jgi:hypothetical protein
MGMSGRLGWFVRSGLVVALVACCGVWGGVAFGLSEGRVFERVSPAYKGGYGVAGLSMVSANGERVAFESLGTFAGIQSNTLTNMYLASRTDSVGWTSSSLQSPPGAAGVSFSSGLEYVVAAREPRLTAVGEPTEGAEYLLHNVDLPNVPATWERFGPLLLQANEKPYEGLAIGGSADLCHQIIGATEPLMTVPPLVQTAGTLGQIYDESRGCDGTEPYLVPVALNNAGNVINIHCGTELGVEGSYSETPSGGTEQESRFNTVSAHGGAIFFTTSVELNSNCRAHQLFARLGAERTVEVSKPLNEACGEVPCPGALARASAYFTGASEDGTKVYFTTSAALTASDKDTANDLYSATLGCGEGEAGCGLAEQRVVSLVQVSHDPVVGESAGMVGVLRVSSDGSRVYFVAHGVLSEGPNVEGHAPVSGADNLYAYDAQTGVTSFVVDLCSGPALSGSTEDTACPTSLAGRESGHGGGDGPVRNDSELWGPVQPVQSTRDGRVLVFTSYGQLLEDDADSARDVYRYDDVTGLLVRVSTGENGYDSNGNDEFDAGIVTSGIDLGNPSAFRLELTARVVSDDGDRIVFTSASPLSAHAANGLPNIYEWRGGEGGVGVVSLLTDGSSPTEDEGATISPSGRDVFFVTASGLASGDEDGLRDVYDARLGGGFAEQATPRQPCSGDACQGALTNPLPLLIAGSAVQEAGENFAPPAKGKLVKKKPRRNKARRGKRGRRARARLGHRGGAQG